MKKLFYILFAALVFAACTEDLLPENQSNSIDGDKVTLSFSLGVPEAETVMTRSFGEMDEDGEKRLRLAVRLFVFDNNGFFVESANAVNKANPESPADQTNFEVTLTKSGTPRRIHFVAVDTVEAGTGKTFDDVVEKKYSYGSEATVMNGMSVTDHNDAYWQRVTVDAIDENTKFTRVPLIRNFNHFVVELSSALASSGHFTLTGFALLHRPTKGSVAPYNTLTGSFQVFNNGETMLNYHEISAVGQYQGYQPSDTGWEETDSTNVTFADPTTGIYMYGSRNASGAGIQGRTYIIVKGNYTNGTTGVTYNDRYYKLDIIYKDADGTANFYNILRNFQYRVIIQSVTFEGYDSPAAAARAPATNNISASVQAQTVNNISDGSARHLYLNDLYFLFNKGGESNGDILCKFFGYTNDEATQTGWRNDIISVSVLSGSEIFQEQPTIASATMDANNWSKVQFTLKEPTDVPQTATLRFAVHGVGRFETLYRDVTILLRKPYTMLVDCQDVVEATTNTPMFVNILIPDGINSMLFPLPFYLEGAKASIYPNASLNQLPVHIGTTITGGTTSSFQFLKTLTYSEYSAAATRVVDGQTYRIIPCYFKTNVAASSTRVYVANEYFSTGSDIFQNGEAIFPETDDMRVEIIPSDYYGAGNSYNYVKFLTVRNNATVTLTLNEGGTTKTQSVDLATTIADAYAYSHSYTSNGDGTYTHTVRLPTQTFSGSSYTATVSYAGDFNQDFSGTATLARHYIYIPIGSFETNVGSNGYNADEKFRSYTGGVNTGRVGFTANGTTEVYNRSAARTDGGFTWPDGVGYHIYDTNIIAANGSVTESMSIRFFDPSSHNNTTYDGDTYITGWEATVNLGDLTSRHAVDVAAGATEATGTTAGLYKWQLTFGPVN